MATITIKRNAGEPVTVDPGGPWTAREQIDWEQQFRSSFVTVFQAIAAERDSAVAAGLIDADGNIIDQSSDGELPAEPVALHFRVSWMLWFAWHRLRAGGDAPGKFETWLDTVEYEFNEPEPEVAADPASAVHPDPDPEPLDPLSAELAALEDGSLGPTSPRPTAPATAS
jgi:hypothetical protein